MKQLYNGPHYHAALICLQANQKENAASWMNRDIGEEHPASDYAVIGRVVLKSINVDYLNR